MTFIPTRPLRYLALLGLLLGRSENLVVMPPGSSTTHQLARRERSKLPCHKFWKQCEGNHAGEWVAFPGALPLLTFLMFSILTQQEESSQIKMQSLLCATSAVHYLTAIMWKERFACQISYQGLANRTEITRIVLLQTTPRGKRSTSRYKSMSSSSGKGYTGVGWRRL
jgi:hypothetical protein